MRRRLPVLLLLLPALLAVACSDDDGGDTDEDAGASRSVEEVLAEVAAMELSDEDRVAYLYDKAQEEGAVLLYGTSNIELQEPWNEGFQEAFPGINNLYVRQRSEDLYERVLAEARADRHLVDVINANAVVGAELHANDLIADHHGVPVPDGYPEQYVDDWAITGYISPNVFAWNTDMVSPEDAPKELDDFLDPALSGCVVDSGSESFAAALILDRGYEGAVDWYEAFFDNGGVVHDSHSATAAALAAGEVACSADSYSYSIEELVVEGAPIEWFAPDPTPANATSMYVYRHTQRPYAAALFIWWVLSQEGAEVVTETGRISVHPEVEQRYPRLQPWTEAGSDLQDQLYLLTPEVAEDVSEEALELLQTVVVPRLVED